MAETKIDLTSSTNLTVAEANHIQFLPCNINYSGTINLSSHFNPYVRKQSSEGKESE